MKLSARNPGIYLVAVTVNVKWFGDDRTSHRDHPLGYTED